MGWSLAQLFVEISAKGFDSMAAQIDQLEKKTQVFCQSVDRNLSAATASFGSLAKSMLISPEAMNALAAKFDQIKKQTLGIGEAFTLLQSKAAWAFAGITGSTLLWVRAGLQGTTVGNALAVQFQFLSREIASVFLPQIMAVVNGVRNVVVWFRNLTGEQQALIGKVIITAAALTGMVMILPSIVSGVGTLITVWKALNVAFVASPIGTAVAVIVALAMGTEKGRAAVMRLVVALGGLVGPLASISATTAEFVSKLSSGVVVLFAAAIEKLISLMEMLKKEWDSILDRINAIRGGENFDPKASYFDQAKWIIMHPLRMGEAALTGTDEGALASLTGKDKKAPAGHQSLTSGHIGFENANQTYRRIAEAGLRNEMPNLQRQGNATLVNIQGITEKIQEILNRGQAVGRQLIGP